MIYNVVVSKAGTLQINNVMNDNITCGTTENAASDKTKIYKNSK